MLSTSFVSNNAQNFILAFIKEYLISFFIKF